MSREGHRCRVKVVVSRNLEWVFAEIDSFIKIGVVVFLCDLAFYEGFA